jgi:hypothetical protein
MESKYARWIGLTDPLGHSVPASLTQILYEAGPAALFFWVGPTTRWVNPTQSHPESRARCNSGLAKDVQARTRPPLLALLSHG